MKKMEQKITISKYIGFDTVLLLMKIIENTIEEYGLSKELLCCFGNDIYLRIKEDDADADTLGSCISEINKRVSDYIQTNYPETD